MRLLVLAFMIFLLPLRGWMGDAMATDIAIHSAAATVGTTKTVAESAHKTGTSAHFGHANAAQTAATSVRHMHPDCSGHTSNRAMPSAEVHDTQDEHCEPCQSCQACHTVALSSYLPEVRGAFAAPPTPRATAAEFTSAMTALGQKPPIS